MTMTDDTPRTALTSGLTRQRTLGKGPDPKAEERFNDEAREIRSLRDQQRITARTFQRRMAAAEERRDRALLDTRVTYTFTSRDLGPWTISTSTDETIPGEFGAYPRALAAAREHHSHIYGAGRARAGQYIRLDVGAVRSTGAHVQALDLAHPDSEYEPEPGFRWATRCVTHGTLVKRRGYTEARDEASRPQEWCPPCREHAEREAEEVRGK